MKLAQRLEQEVLGFYSPSRNAAISFRDDEASLHTTRIHETAHLQITERSTLGFVASMCGAYRMFGSDEKIKSLCGEYIGQYFKKSLWIQEGCATTSELIWGNAASQFEGFALSPDEIFRQRPTQYVLAASDYLSMVRPVAEAVGDRLKLSAEEWLVAIPMSLTESIAICAMSPPLPADFAESALNGKSDVWQEPLNTMWARFERLIATPPVKVTEVICRTLSALDVSVSDLNSGDLLPLLTDSLYECTELPRGSINKQEIISNSVPDLREHLIILDHSNPEPRDEDTTIAMGQYVFLADLAPEPIEFEWATTEQLLGLPDAPIRYIEVMPLDMTANTGLVVHDFGSDGEHWRSVQLGPTLEISRDLFLHILRTLRVPYMCSPPRVVVGEAARTEHLRSLVDGIQVCTLQFNFHNPSEISDAHIIGNSSGVELLQITLKSGEVLWMVTLGMDDDDLDANHRALAWVLRNGRMANVRWSLHHQ